MRIRKNINRILKPLTGYEITKAHFGQDLWADAKTLLADGEIKTVFDVGANEGQSAREFCRGFPLARIYSFEPAPGPFQLLSRFAGGQPRVTPVNQALGETPGQAEFHENNFDQTSSFLPASVQSGAYFGSEVFGCRRKIRVEVTTLDTFCRRESIEKIDLLKLDVQGFELNVLKGARDFLEGGRIGCLVLELAFVPLYENQPALNDLAAFLGEYQYKLAGFYDFAQSARLHLMWCEAIFHRARGPTRG
jgi:FkbM family methyltransferase